MKTIEEYLNLPYTIELIPEKDGSWFVAIKEMPGCMSSGDTPEEAVAMIRDAQRAWIEIALEDGFTIPEPRTEEEYSGNFRLRVPHSLHRKLVKAAEVEEVSLNAYCAGVLSEAIGEARAKTVHKAESERDRRVRELLEDEKVDMNGKDLNTCLAQWLAREIRNARQDMHEGDATRGGHHLYALVRDLKRLHQLEPLLGTVVDLLDWMRDSVEEPTSQVGVQSSFSSVIDAYSDKKARIAEPNRKPWLVVPDMAKPDLGRKTEKHLQRKS